MVCVSFVLFVCFFVYVGGRGVVCTVVVVEGEVELALNVLSMKLGKIVG